MTKKDDKNGLFNQLNATITEKMQAMKKLFSNFSSFMEKNSGTISSEEEMERIVSKMAIIGLMESIKTYADAVKQTVATSATDKNYVLPVYMNAMLNALAVAEKLLAKEEAKALLKNTVNNGGDNNKTRQKKRTKELEDDSSEEEETTEELDNLIYGSDPVDPDDGIDTLEHDSSEEAEEDSDTIVDKDAFNFFTEKLGRKAK